MIQVPEYSSLTITHLTFDLKSTNTSPETKFKPHYQYPSQIYQVIIKMVCKVSKNYNHISINRIGWHMYQMCYMKKGHKVKRNVFYPNK